MKFDIDISDVVPGSTIEESECERIIGIKRSEDMYRFQFALMQLGEYVGKLLWKDGKQYTVRTSNGCVEILSHEEASTYNASRFDLAISKMRRCHRRLIAVDAGQLPDEKRGQHTDSIVRQSKMLLALRDCRKERDLTPVASKRSMPVRVVK